MDSKHWVFISPHFDDVALSCGGLVWELTRQGHSVEVWTIMAGYPTSEDYTDFANQNHLAWGMSGKEAICMRRGEDRAACEILGARPRHFDWLDAIYRRNNKTGDALVNNNQELFSKLPEDVLVNEIIRMLRKELLDDTVLVLPMGLGNHVDHQAVSHAGERIKTVNYYYADYPYILENFDNPIFVRGKVLLMDYRLSQDALCPWQDAVLSYASQLSGFWRDDDEARLALQNYLAGGGGRLWAMSESDE
jgi:hypothetical protein